jgi:peptidoglycan/xylan/chitin deacetylase (PgdA/CDA1 family)
MHKGRSHPLRIAGKRLMLYALRAAGLFAVARRLSRRRLRILCYHGFSIGDQHEYAPILFMRPEVFARRLELLERLGHPVLPLAEALDRMRHGKIGRAEVVITIDDGWKSTAALAAPLLKRHKMAASLYLTTFHAERGDVVPDAAIAYMLWRTARSTMKVRGVARELDGDFDIRGNEAALIVRWTDYARGCADAGACEGLLKTLAAILDVDFAAVAQRARFALVGPEDVACLRDSGIDIQMHTHTHNLPPADFEAAATEIRENRRALERMGVAGAVHFCYPSGRYSPQHPQWLAKLGVESAMTCDVGSNAHGDSPYLLKRYLDRDDAWDVEFEAELSGISDLLRSLRGTIGRPPETPT